jgi:hypothetical protein
MLYPVFNPNYRKTHAQKEGKHPHYRCRAAIKIFTTGSNLLTCDKINFVIETKRYMKVSFKSTVRYTKLRDKKGSAYTKAESYRPPVRYFTSDRRQQRRQGNAKPNTPSCSLPQTNTCTVKGYRSQAYAAC